MIALVIQDPPLANRAVCRNTRNRTNHLYIKSDGRLFGTNNLVCFAVFSSDCERDKSFNVVTVTGVKTELFFVTTPGQ